MSAISSSQIEYRQATGSSFGSMEEVFIGTPSYESENLAAESMCRLSSKYKFEKPNHRPALELMNAAAKGMMEELPELILAYGMSDEYRYFLVVPRCFEILANSQSFVFHEDCTLFERRAR